MMIPQYVSTNELDMFEVGTDAMCPLIRANNPSNSALLVFSNKETTSIVQPHYVPPRQQRLKQRPKLKGFNKNELKLLERHNNNVLLLLLLLLLLLQRQQQTALHLRPLSPPLHLLRAHCHPSRL
jgi:hypothetical protein